MTGKAKYRNGFKIDPATGMTQPEKDEWLKDAFKMLKVHRPRRRR
jgi:hypothetical protein